MIYQAKHQSHGFQGRYWQAGDLTDDLPEDIAACEEIKAHFEPHVTNAAESREVYPAFTYGDDATPEQATKVLEGDGV